MTFLKAAIDWQSDLTLDDLEGSKIFDVKYAKNEKSYAVAPMRFTLHDLERLKVKVNPFI